ncbi:MAG TPA: HAMP domain-containing sensor histidine kinase [Steroidobacteraceae bacterium]|jgi:signal transduction histidine kinase|nr:HAMP domain-containing sensor histidine kinase [Steroidobacteraceae bacterium]
MRRAHSIRARLSFVFLFLFLLVIVLGLESLSSLSYVNEASAQVRDRWLPSTRALGDLNNFTTDFPAAEGALLRARSASEKETIERQIAALDRGISAAQRAYRQIRHDAAEDELYTRFAESWSKYRSNVARAESLPSPAMEGGVTSLPEKSSKSAYDTASDALAMLTDRNVGSAREASERSDLVYSQARRRIALTILLAGLLVAGSMIHVRRSISAPLVDLAERMHRVAASETSVEVLGTQRHDEIGEMARAVVVFRNNAVDLARNRQALALQATMLQEKLAEEQRLTLLQRNFVSMASHEFRTPLAIIDGHAQRLISMRERLTADELAERARKVRSTVARMTQLIDNLIGSARLIDGGIDLYFHPAQVDLAALVRDVSHLQRELTPNAQILERIEPEPLLVRGDASLLCQVFGNLLSNAVKYSPEGGLIQVITAREGAHTVVVIEDCGIGIPDKDRRRVFERYYRGSNTSGIVGSGVGLYLVKAIVELHEGSVVLESCEGEGSRFTVRLPMSEAGDPVRLGDADRFLNDNFTRGRSRRR